MPMKPTPANAWGEFETFQKVDHLPGHKIPFCGLCGNTGTIDTIGITKTPQGKPCGIRAFCICPNGRAMKKGWFRDKKWGGTSVLAHEGFGEK